MSMQPLHAFGLSHQQVHRNTDKFLLVSPGFKKHEDIAESVFKPSDVGAAVHEES